MVELIVQEPRQPTPPPPVFAEFPKTMTHPGARKSVPVLIPGTERYDSLGRLIEGSGAFKGTPEVLPPVLVHNQDDQAYYEAQGYRSAGTMDASAFNRMANAPAAPPHEVQEYPKWIGDKLVGSAEEEAAVSQSARIGAEVETDGPTVAPGKPVEATASPWAAEDLAAMTKAPGRPLTPSERAKAAWARRRAKAEAA